jgi:catechol 2,3-dioxygenase-like lactoylglutathione lyase family enzyme
VKDLKSKKWEKGKVPMKINVDIRPTLNLPPVSHIGIVVKELDKAIAYYENVFGLGPFVWSKMRSSERYYYGRPTDFEMIIGSCPLGPIEVELIQPVTPPTIYHDFLERKGEGLHHLGFDVEDMDERLERYEKMGIKAIQHGRGPSGGGYAYLDSKKE